MKLKITFKLTHKTQTKEHPNLPIKLKQHSNLSVKLKQNNIQTSHKFQQKTLKLTHKTQTGNRR